MKIDKKYKLEKIVSKDKTREHIGNVCIDKKHDAQARAIATNGRMLASVPVDIEDCDDFHDEKVLPAKVFSEARKVGGKRVEQSTIQMNGASLIGSGETFPYPEDTRPHPNWRQIMPDWKDTEYGEITLDAKMLFELAQAVGCDQNRATIRVRLQGGGSGKTIDPLHPVEIRNGMARGVLMPVRTN